MPATAAGIDARWYAPLLQPVLAPVSRALEQVTVEGDPWALPRTGLGGAMVLQVSRGFGNRARRKAEQAVVAAFEGYNHRLHVGQPDADERARWLARDLRWARKAWRSLAERNEPTLTRVVDRLFGPNGEVCDRPIPEAVLFMRGAVAAGVVLGEVPDATHERLDVHVTWLALSWEARAQTLDAEGWHGALAAVGLRVPFPEPCAAESLARARATEALAALPDTPAVESFQRTLAQAVDPSRGETTLARSVSAWTPMATPALTARPTRPGAQRSKAGGTIEHLRERWAAAIEDNLAELTASRSEVLERATTYLRDQGGKRVRPLLTLAAAEASGGDPRRALPLAASVEWLHQGTLVLDDIIDAAALRRGHAALHSATTEVFATGVAVFVLGRVLQTCHGMHPDIRDYVVSAAIGLADGERLELLHTGDAELSMTRYYAIIEAKTARLFSCATAVGALCAEADRATVRALTRYGRELGLAFQIVDDLLDYTGDATTFGKRPGTDLRAAKMTLPLLLLRDRYDRDDREHRDDRARLGDALGDDADDTLAWIQSQLADHEIAEQCRQRAATHGERASEALAALPPSEARDALAQLARELGARSC